jgi:methyl acetate hydrolase
MTAIEVPTGVSLNAEARAALDARLDAYVEGRARVPGIAAALTGRHGIIYRGAAGVRNLEGDAPMQTDTVCAVFSVTKAICATVCLQLHDEGLLDLDAPAREYVSSLADVQVLAGFSPDGQPRLRAPRREPTTRMLLLHTSGFTYDTFNRDHLRLVEDHGLASIGTLLRGSLDAPLLFDPGERWEYGIGVDWAGQVVEAITGQSLGDAMRDRVFTPLGMNDTSFTITPQLRARLATVHARLEDQSLAATDYVIRQDAEFQSAGHGLYSTVEDFAKFIHMWLADGAGPDGPVLAPETVAMASRNGLGELKVRPLPGLVSALSRDVDFFPGISKSWALSFMVNDQDAPTGRRAGSLAWAGISNVFFWIDRATGIGGIWATQVLPFMDPISLDAYLEFETAAYRGLRR